MGSSPLARGPPFWYGGGASAAGLIPARAGTTREGFSSKTCSRAHPRSRGDHEAVGAPLIIGPGSSPLARGPRSANWIASNPKGLIPARAGTTFSVLAVSVACGAHPRSRGDHTLAPNNRRTRLGSSPLARGPLQCTVRRRRFRGLIPARAGTTSAEPFAALRRWAHPRSRGDHRMAGYSSRRVWGSSPLARGPLTV